MYFPYLRGRQYELLALRELAQNDLIGAKVTPIIEPIKPSATLTKTILEYIDTNKEIAFITNPLVGNFFDDFNALKDEKVRDSLIGSLQKGNVIVSHILNQKSNSQIHSLLEQGFGNEKLLLICEEKEYLNYYFEFFQEEAPRYCLIPEESAFRRKIKHNRVLVADRFSKQAKNADYSAIDEAPFSEDHLYFKEDGFIGFSDYSIVGKGYIESGFAPYAVAIHIVFFAEDKSLRIKHFVSDSNDDFNDPAGKFYEAIRKLAEWQEEMQLDTFGMNEFLKHFKNGTYPGLGTVKKLSIMHHIELVSKFLDGVE
ncbi:sce7725 family protein [Neobacillus sp. SCS-31]|uniref:sce7725 family protein n=1 Tax=Neobacillus oceani TaxID=3115292 RepID=UPI0039066868